EIDPVAKQATGNKICRQSLSLMRAVAYNPITDTYYVGTYGGGGVIDELDSRGESRRFFPLPFSYGISRLPLHPSPGPLFVQVNDEPQFVWVLDVNTPFFDVVTAFPLAAASGPAYGAFEGAGLEIDCAGNLWSVNQASKKIFVNKSGESNACVTPWLSERP